MNLSNLRAVLIKSMNARDEEFKQKWLSDVDKSMALLDELWEQAISFADSKKDDVVSTIMDFVDEAVGKTAPVADSPVASETTVSFSDKYKYLEKNASVGIQSTLGMFGEEWFKQNNPGVINTWYNELIDQQVQEFRWDDIS